MNNLHEIDGAFATEIELLEETGGWEETVAALKAIRDAYYRLTLKGQLLLNVMDDSENGVMI